MPIFTWYKKYSVENEELDDHHKKLFDIFNRLYDNCSRADSVDCIVPVLKELTLYSDYHFSAEERYMAAIGYGDVENHRKMHRFFSEKVLEIQNADTTYDSEPTKELIVFLGTWLLHHVLEEDRKYVA